MQDDYSGQERIEFSLDSRQILFLLFGLAVVGCFVFALGLLAGRRMHWTPESEFTDGEALAATIQSDASGEVIETEEEVVVVDASESGGEEFAYVEGVREDDAADLPKTRPASVAPRDEEQIKAEKAKEREAKSAALARTQRSENAGARGEFTLQLKRFDQQDAADALVRRLKRSGYAVRVQRSEKSGKTWFVVSVGDYSTWDAALEAKKNFEAKEGIVAYAARQ